MRLISKDYRNMAWRALSGKWLFMVGITLISGILTGVISLIPFVGNIGSLLISGPLSFGYIFISMKIYRNEMTKTNDLFVGFNDFGRTFSLYIINSILIFLWSLLLIIPGIIKALAYSMSYYILADNPTLSQSEARRRSEQLMNGHKFRLFCLLLSFLGWILLSFLTFGILLFFVYPYIEVATAAFYDDLIENSSNRYDLDYTYDTY